MNSLFLDNGAGWSSLSSLAFRDEERVLVALLVVRFESCNVGKSALGSVHPLLLFELELSFEKVVALVIVEGVLGDDSLETIYTTKSANHQISNPLIPTLTIPRTREGGCLL
jgi:hypothetical protein